MLGISRRLRRSFYLRAAKIRDHLPDFLVAHPHADAAVRGRGHGRAGNAIVNVMKYFRVRIAVPLLRPREIGTPSAAARAEPVTERAVQAKLVFAQLGHFRIAFERILLLREGFERTKAKHEREQCYPALIAKRKIR